MDIVRRLEVVEQENQLLRERITQLEEALFETGAPLPLEWGLTGSEARVMGLLMTRPMVRKETIMAALYREVGRDEADVKICDVFVCKIRKKLKPFGVEITTVYGQGWMLDAGNRARAQAYAGERMAA